MDEDGMWREVRAQRERLADVLGALPADRWERPSLCEGWTVKDVASHLTVVSDPPPARALLAATVRAGGNPHRMNTLVTRRRSAQRSTDDLVAVLRRTAGSRKYPAVTDRRNVLFDLLVHCQDVAVPLGLELPTSPAAAVDAVDRVWAMGWPFRAQRRLRGVTLTAVDAAWTVGSGPEVRGPVAALLLLLTGRPAAVPALSGPGVALLSGTAVAAATRA